MEVNDDLLRGAATKPVGLCATRQHYALRCEAIVFRKLQIYRGRGAVHIAILGEVEVAELGAEHGEHDVLEVRIRAIGAFEGGRKSTTGC
tara:strand:+ start:2105 stop:2374 length:270 start_codon:yes stop_codon:yes gene_type:complete